MRIENTPTELRTMIEKQKRQLREKRASNSEEEAKAQSMHEKKKVLDDLEAVRDEERRKIIGWTKLTLASHCLLLCRTLERVRKWSALVLKSKPSSYVRGKSWTAYIATQAT